MNPELVASCRERLIEVARTQRTIFYSELAAYIGVDNQDPRMGQCLDEIYERETAAQRPDLTLVVISKETGFGHFNSRGRSARSVRVNKKDEDDVATYVAELQRVYDHWAK